MRMPMLVCFLFTFPAFAVTIERPLTDIAQEQQAQAIFSQLKCVVCEGQALAESDAALARQMRGQIRDMVSDGHGEQEILDSFVVRYGKQVLMNPPLERATLLLWFAPLLLLAGGAMILKRAMR